MQKPGFWFSKRFLVAVLLYIGQICNSFISDNINIAIIDMTNEKTMVENNRTVILKPEFDWNSQIKGLLLGAQSIGGLFLILGGQVALRFGGARVIGTMGLMSSLLNMLNPVAVRCNFHLLLVLKILDGICHAFQFVSISEMWSQWSPIQDRSKLIAISFAGIYAGSAVAYPVSGYIIHVFGWPAIFYATGGMTLLWSMIWLYLVPNDPAKDKYISTVELKYIKGNQKYARPKSIVLLWKNLLQSKHVWALCIAKFVYSAGFTMVVTCLPLYIKDITNTKIHQIGMLASIPNISGILIVPLLGYIMDIIHNKDWLTTTQVHKLFLCSGFLGSSVSLFLVAYFSSQFVIAISLLIVFKILSFFAFIVTHSVAISMAPQCSSVVSAFIGMFYKGSSMITPIVVGFIVTTHSPIEWSICFSILGVIMIFGAIVFFLFGSSETQPWSYAMEDENLLVFLGQMNSSSLRANLNIAIVEMTSNRSITLQNETIIYEPEFNWDSQTKGLVLSVHSYGGFACVVGGYLALKIGGATLIFLGTLIASIITLLTPTIVCYNFSLFMALRMMEGIAEVFAFESIAELWSRWSPKQDRSRLMAIGHSGKFAGSMVAYVLCGFLIHMYGWPAAFYVTGGISMIWTILWFSLVTDNPSSDRWISKEELAYIEQHNEQKKPTNLVPVWKGILTSKPTYALGFSKFVYTLGGTVIVTCLPMYVKDITNARIDKVGIYSALPNIINIFNMPLIGYVMDSLQNHKTLTPTQVHKLLMCTGFVIGGSLLLILSFVPASIHTSMVCLTLYKVTISANFITAHMNCIALAPQCASVLAGFLSTFHMMAAVATPMIIAFIVTDHNPSQWHICFIFFGVMSFIGAIVYLLFGSSEPQTWASPVEIGENCNASTNDTSKHTSH